MRTAHALLAALPRGRTLPRETWGRRHRGLLLLLAAHVALLPAFGLLQGWSLAFSVATVVPSAVFGALAAWGPGGRSVRAACCAMGLLSCSAALVVLWHGTIEAHFHYFVMTAALALYEEWLVFLLAVGYVVLQHGLMSQIAGHAVFAHPMTMDDGHSMWFWALVHGGFIAGLAVFELLSWRANEGVRRAVTDALAEAHRSTDQLRTSFEHAPISMAVIDRDGTLRQVNQALTDGFGPQSELLGRPFAALVEAGDRRGLAAWVAAPARERELRTTRADGTTGWMLWSHSALPGSDGDVLLQGVDITARKAAESELIHQAQHDPLTGLANRVRFSAELRAALAARPEHEGVGVLFIDLDNFKVVNDSLGHTMGDELLVAVAERLRDALRPTDLLARFGGDEFVVCLPGATSVEDLERVADRIGLSLSPPIILGGQPRFATASIGIAYAEAGDVAGEALIRDADAAMYRAKAQGKARRETFDESLREQALERLELEHGLRLALQRDELELHFQPMVTLDDEKVIGAEALLRWRHPRHGLVPPLRFIGIAEQSGLIVPIGAWVLAEACRQAAAWLELPGHAGFIVAVNLSPLQLGDPDLCETVAGVLRDTGMPPGQLCLEMTESAVMADPDAGHAMLVALKRLGVRLAIDDFGVGQSSLSHLRQLLPIDQLKIDRSFVDDLVDGADSRAIVQAIVDLSEALGVEAIAEGVETADQAAELGALNCRLGQGFHFARPMLPAALAGLLAGERPRELGGV